MLLILVLCTIFAGVKGYNTTRVNQCVINQGEFPLNAYVEGCTTPPCIFAQTTDAVIHVIFKSPRLLNTVHTFATAILTSVGGFHMNYPLGANSETCNFLTNTYCPLLPEEVVQYTLRMHIELFFPVGTQADIEFRVADKRRVSIWCIRIPISITSPP